MEIRVHLCREPPVYTAADEVSGHVILTTETQADISAVSVKLAGVATTGLLSGKLLETHQIVNIREQLFPPSNCASAFSSRSATVPAGRHVFPFSIKFPQATQCSKTPFQGNEQRSSTGASRKTHHLLRKLPPSTGNSSSPEEIRYVVEASVRQDGIIRTTKKATRDIHFQLTSILVPPLHAQVIHTQTQRITCSAGANSTFLSPPITCEVQAKLLNGPFLVTGQPIPLSVDVLNMNLESSTGTDPRQAHVPVPIPITLHDFQTMLIETTETRARGAVDSQTRFWVVQTMANLRHPFVAAAGNGGAGWNGASALMLDRSLWAQYCISSSLTPTFETCNISRSYKLEVRLGIGFGGNNVRIVEFQFPIQVVSLAGPRVETKSGSEASAEFEEPAPAYYEKEAFAKELEFGL
ncbi:uncharacterized protein DSM5745_11003 [Aspergillus mulundensis]|uniref:Arrestin-like N-terminal domain-containing protein n=1 Tax=Aspergillus mulundensis TaxID=1810919 RepID=A0A3D8QCI0_9EURO|nr:hypothetical protein DSM5745_11003 [Aspergillus mulundensis]RDW59308.1 hypothetical protein DSM5745_11003 [Aspergillus mulundensis]